MMFPEIVIWIGGFALAAFCLFWIVYAILAAGPHFWSPRDGGGDAEKGLAVWVEPVAFPALRWGERTAATALRRAGFGGEFVFWSWHARWRGLLVLPALMARERIEREAQRLADLIARRRGERPDAPIYLLGYSCGGFVALRALELLPEGVRVTGAALLAAVFSPRRDLAPALSHVDDKLVVSASLMDWGICGLGTLLFGTGDRKFTPSAGMLGVLGSDRDHPKLRQLRWRPGMIPEGILGLHDWCLPAGVLARYVLPGMGIRHQGKSVQATVWPDGGSCPRDRV